MSVEKRKRKKQYKTKQNSGHCYRMMQSALTVSHCYDRRKSFFSPCVKSWSGDIDMKIKKIHSIQKNDYVIHSICYNVMGNTFNDGLGEQYGKHSLSYWRNTVNSSDSGICPKDYVPELPTVRFNFPS